MRRFSLLCHFLPYGQLLHRYNRMQQRYLFSVFWSLIRGHNRNSGFDFFIFALGTEIVSRALISQYFARICNILRFVQITVRAVYTFSVPAPKISPCYFEGLQRAIWKVSVPLRPKFYLLHQMSNHESAEISMFFCAQNETVSIVSPWHRNWFSNRGCGIVKRHKCF